MEGIHATGYIFVPAAGIMASIPYLTVIIEKACGPFSTPSAPTRHWPRP